MTEVANGSKIYYRPTGRTRGRPFKNHSVVRTLELVRRARALDMGLPEVKELVHWASTGTCDDLRLHEVLHRKLEEVDQRIAALEHLRQDLQRLEAHLTTSQKEAIADHTVLECSPETCNCLGDTTEDKIKTERRSYG